MIQFVKRNQLDENKYNACISASLQSRIYAYSWYLDIVTDNWSVLVLDDYQAVMPLPWRVKYGVKYVYPPLWLIELGFFSLKENTSIDLFFKAARKKFLFIETRLNTDNSFDYIDKKQLHYLKLEEEYITIYKDYNKDKKKDLRKSSKFGLIEKWNDDPKKIIHLFKKNVGARIPNVKEADYDKLLKILRLSIKNDVGEILSIYNSENVLVASGFFLKHKSRVTLLISSTNFENRKNGANTFLIDRAIFRFQKEFDTFHFGGSSITSIGSYFMSFGAEVETYLVFKKRLL
jgi:hypothetical protein